MEGQHEILQCPLCSVQFDYEKRQPMILCMAQHTSCRQCVDDMFRGKNKEELINCPFRCGRIHYGSIQKFRFLSEIIETKHQLKRYGSCLKKQKINMDTDKKKMFELLEKEKAKNEWLIQLHQKKNNSLESDKIIKQLKIVINKQRVLIESSFAKSMTEMELRYQLMLKDKFKEYEKQNNQKNVQLQAERKKSQVNTEQRLQVIEKQMNQQLTVIKKIQQSTQPLENLQKNLKRSREFQDLSLKAMKTIEANGVNIKKHLQIIDELLNQIKTQNKNIKNDDIIKNQKDKNISVKKQSKNINNPLLKIDNKVADKKDQVPVQKIVYQYKPLPLFSKKSDPYIVFEAKKEQSQEMNRLRSITYNMPKIYQKVKTEPNEKIGQIKRGNWPKNNFMRASLGPEMIGKYNFKSDDEQDTSCKTSRDNTYFKDRNKNTTNYLSQKNLLGNISLIEQQTAQQKKVASIIEKIQLMFGKNKVSNKSIALKKHIDKEIHLPEEQIVKNVLKTITF